MEKRINLTWSVDTRHVSKLASGDAASFERSLFVDPCRERDKFLRIGGKCPTL